MKRLFQYIRISVLTVLSAAALSACSAGGNVTINEDGSNIQAFRFSESSNNDYWYTYDLIRNENTILLIINGFDPNHRNSDEDAVSMETELTEDQFTEFAGILKKYHIETWDGFNKSDDDVLDGSSFYMLVSLDDEQTIEASGYMKYPENFHEARDAICGYLQEAAGLQSDGQ